MNQKILFIDWNNTLSKDLFWGHMADTSHHLNNHFGIIQNWLFSEHKDVIGPWMRGRKSTTDILRHMSQDTGLSFDLILRELETSCREMSFCLPSLATIIYKIRDRGIKVVIATDNMDTFRRITVPSLNLDLIFDDILISSEIGALKDDPHPKNKIPFFDDYLRDEGLPYGDALLLDDSPDSTGKYASLGFGRRIIKNPESLKTELEKIAYA